MNLWILIPVYNEEKHLREVINKLNQYISLEKILVVDDGSADNTCSIAQSCKVTLIRHDVNMGKGAALKTGFQWLSTRNAEWVITIDGDMQHDPDMTKKFIDEAVRTNADMVVGRRIRTADMPWDRQFSNWCTSFILTLVTSQKIFDSQSGYRAIRLASLMDIDLHTDRFEVETEMLLEFARNNFKINWIDIPTTYGGETSSIDKVTDTLRFVKIILRYIIKGRRKA